ncbi:hypothetical protein [Streptomyces sp. NPDC101234]|uniref:hypothetical protein n=1 Tax=Streptomyces sp. NPDC101234 TaxID=3366138 RepID=UPI003812D797
MVAASGHDDAIGIALLDNVAATAPTVTKGWADAPFKQTVVEHGARLGIDVEIVQRDPGARGCTPAPKRCVVEQTFGALLLHRRLAQDYERRSAGSVAVIHWSMSDVMLRRLTRSAPPDLARCIPGEREWAVRVLLDKIEARQRLVRETVERLREQITELTGQLAVAEHTLERLETDRETVLELATEDGTPPPGPLPPGYHEILALFEQNGDGLRARELCRTLGTGTGTGTEPESGLFALTPPVPTPPETNSR